MTMRYATVLLIVLGCGLAASAAQNLPAQEPVAPCGPNVSDSRNVAKDSRCFELRTYTVAPGLLDKLHMRFRDHTMALFKKHRMMVVGFWHPTNKPNTLIYLLVFKDRQTRDDAWKAFQADPEWVKVRTDIQVDVKVDSVFMSATDYAPLK